MADAPPPWEDSDENEEDQHNAWKHLLQLFTFQGSSPMLQQCLKEEELCKTALTCQFALDVIYSGRARLEQLVKRGGRHADVCPPHAAVAAKNPQSAASWRHHDGPRLRCCAPDEEDSLR